MTNQFEKKNMKKKHFGRHVIEILRFFVFSVFNYFKTNATSVIFGSTPLINEINTIFGKKNKNFEICHFQALKPRFFEKKNVKVRKKG